MFIHSHKKGKDSLETQTVLLIFPLDIFVVAIHHNSIKWWFLWSIAQ